MSDVARLRRLAAAAVVASAVLPPDLVRNGPSLCTFRAITGRPCPSCGLTRSWNAMGHGQLRAAARFHLLGPVTFVGALAIIAAGDRRTVRALQTPRWRPLVGAFTAAWIGAWFWQLTRGIRG